MISVGEVVVNALISALKVVVSTIGREEVKDNYNALKQFIGDKFKLNKTLERLEKSPSQERQTVLIEDLDDAIDTIDIGTFKKSAYWRMTF